MAWSAHSGAGTVKLPRSWQPVVIFSSPFLLLSRDLLTLSDMDVYIACHGAEDWLVHVLDRLELPIVVWW
ncbi:hypothetical protein COCC4DRAFT_31020 [Bipolaris maydis ATCC 48331]|uniref:Uncharacterized protein n=2 Tax=Cochliobolus heterostrophus TaxID=5016 RepID=M2T8Y5_COCH5|nr:uncharacterized protein COCC4DRAFT_31020 [Bipolaris maydis ATCC 48331]EMD94015.1 hypothetical protein COCHEDRAFT_1020150 [Bipolaris maydis C5]ENI07683.1 hypothetical protein COCC4DRAFT_31020 [Bipolaris maydis ATCC 48331]